MSDPQKEPIFIKVVITSDVYDQLDNFKRDWKGKNPEDVLVRVETGNSRSKEQEFTLSEFLEALGLEDADEEIKPCQTCGGTGQVTTMEPVYPGESHTAPIGTARCPDCNPGPTHDRDED